MPDEPTPGPQPGDRGPRPDGPTVDAAAIERAASVIAGLIRRTPVVPSAALSSRLGGDVVLKAENLQRTGAFKVRGAMHKLDALGDDVRRGVTAGSAGNHAQALALAARHHGVPCHIFVPPGAPISKVEACLAFGANVTEAGPTLGDAVSAAEAHAATTGAAFCHPYDDVDVVVGQGTVGLELVADVDDLDTVLVPLGGGGLAAGIAVAVKTARPTVRVIGVQADACAPYAGAHVPDGAIVTLADGIAVKSPGRVTTPLLDRWLDDVLTVDEDAIADAMVLLMERAKLYVEGAGAVGAAAILAGRVRPRRGTTCVVLSGGNVDLGVVPGLIRRHETQAGRRLGVFARIDDRPGGLATLLAVFADRGANLIEVEHVREGIDLHVRETGIHATFEVRGHEHATAVLDACRAAGYDVRSDTPA